MFKHDRDGKNHGLAVQVLTSKSFNKPRKSDIPVTVRLSMHDANGLELKYLLLNNMAKIVCENGLYDKFTDLLGHKSIVYVIWNDTKACFMIESKIYLEFYDIPEGTTQFQIKVGVEKGDSAILL